jgi:hypothetical protein
MPISDSDLLKIIAHFLPGDPLSYKQHEDGSLVVIADTGKKHTFSADQVTVVYNFMKPKPKADPVAASKPRTTKDEVEAASGRISRMPTSREVGPRPSKSASKPKSTS